MTDIFITIVFCLWGVFTLGALSAIWSNNTSIVDMCWAFGPCIAFWGCVIGMLPQPVHILFSIMVTTWSLRLGLFLYWTRVLKGKKDERYTKIEAKWTGNKGVRVLGHFYMQATLQCLLCSAFIPMFLNYEVTLQWPQWIAICLFCIAFIGETIADLQLYQFKQDAQPGVCRQGLWSLCRHPNYFFEWLIWMSIATFSMGTHYHAIAWVAPISMFVIMRYITGPYTEKVSSAKRGKEYQLYQQEVPMFFPSIQILIKRMMP